MRWQMMRWSVGIVRAAAVGEWAAGVEGKGRRMAEGSRVFVAAQVFVPFLIVVVVVMGLIKMIQS